MPLKLFRRQPDGPWYVRGAIRGQRVYETTGIADRGLAEAYRAKREAELFESAVFGARAVVSFQRAALSYIEHEQRSPHTCAYVARLVRHFGATKLSAINQHAADEATKAILRPEAAAATRRRNVYGPLAAILNHAAKRGWCDRPRFDLPSLQRVETPWLAPRQALRLIDAAAPHLRPLLLFGFCVGPRLSEALDLEWSDVDLPAAKIVFRDTKNGRDRVARLPPRAVMALANLPHRDGKVFRRDDGEPYEDRERQEGGQIKTAWRGACRRAGLVRWEICKSGGDYAIPMQAGLCTAVRWVPLITPHGMRHSWATWLYAVTRDPMLVRDEGGWRSLVLVERYAHLAPSDVALDVALVWGASHPRIGTLPFGAYRVHEDEHSDAIA